jgi:NAD(P)-dependent dehydrogenase (short-subunit alcohol dehydrogenase family)
VLLDSLLGLEGKNALIVGGGQGMGKATANLLARAGVGIGVLDLDAGRADAVASAIVAGGGRAAPLVADVLDPGAPERAVREANAALGSLEILVNIVGAAVFVSLTEMTPEQWDLDMVRNTRYVMQAGAEFARLPGQRMAGRSVINVASIAAYNACEDKAAYGAAKAALVSLTKTMAVEWAPIGIRVNGIAPGSMSTDGFKIPAEVERVRSAAIPLGREGTQDDVANVVLFLVSDLAGYITGQTLLCDGGILCKTPLPLVGRAAKDWRTGE